MKANLSYAYRFVTFIFRTGFKLLYKGKIYGLENIPINGGFILAGNHVSHLDPPMIAGHCPRQPVFSFARSTLFKKGIRWLYHRLNMIPVDREKGSDLKAIKKVLSLLEQGHPVMMFPEGTRSLTGIPQRPKKGIGMFAIRSGVPVVPVRIFGTYEALPKGKHWPSFKSSLTIVYGKPLSKEDFEDCRTEKDLAQAVSDRIMQAISQIKRS